MDTVIAALAEGQEMMDQTTFKDHLTAALLAVPLDASLAETYTDFADRRHVRQRALVAATLQAVFTFVNQRLDRNADGSVDVEPEPDALSELASAMRDYEHDRERADMGKIGELIFRPVGRESIVAKRTISAARKNVIRWLALIDVCNAERDIGFGSQAELLRFAAEKGAGKPGSLRTGLSNLRNGIASMQELSMFHDTIDLARRLSAADARKTPFELLLPAIVGLSEP